MNLRSYLGRAGFVGWVFLVLASFSILVGLAAVAWGAWMRDLWVVGAGAFVVGLGGLEAFAFWRRAAVA